MERFARQPRVTLADVARHAQVSKTTVSHVISGNRPVAPATRQRIERSIASLGYRPDGLARSLRTRKTHAVALIVPDLTNPFYPALARGLEDYLDGDGYRAFVCSSDGDPSRERDYLEDLADRRVDGLVLDSFHLRVEDLHAATGGRAPVVWIGGTPPDHPGVDWVGPDDEEGAFQATRHLIERGHRRIAMIDGPAGSGLGRRNGYRRALAEAGLPASREPLVRGDWTRSGGARAMHHLLLDTHPSAVFCSNDLSAIGAIDAIRAVGMRVPGDIAVVGYDDIELASLVVPALTTVVNPAAQTGRTAGRLLVERMSGRYQGPARSVSLPSPLVVRGTS